MNTQPSMAMMGLAREKIMLIAALDVPVQEAPVVVVRREKRQKARPYVHKSSSETGGREGLSMSNVRPDPQYFLSIS